MKKLKYLNQHNVDTLSKVISELNAIIYEFNKAVNRIEELEIEVTDLKKIEDIEIKELLRVNFLNISYKKWKLIDEIKVDDVINVSVLGLYNMLGYDGGMFITSRANEKEMDFIKKYQTYALSI